jgi:hypothetical protein
MVGNKVDRIVTKARRLIMSAAFACVTQAYRVQYNYGTHKVEERVYGMGRGNLRYHTSLPL